MYVNLWLLASVSSLISCLNLCFLQQTLNISSCENVNHAGLSSLINEAKPLRELILAYGSPVSVRLICFSDAVYKLLSANKYPIVGGSGDSCSCKYFAKMFLVAVNQIRWLSGYLFWTESHWKFVCFVEGSKFK